MELKVVLLAGLVGFSGYAAARAPIIQTTHGKVQGKLVVANVNPKSKGKSNVQVEAFLGIPFAQPPTGAKRFAAPKDISPWSGVKQTTEYGASCLQSDDNTFGKFRGADMWNSKTKSEDCLFLNIWRPKGTTPRHKLPIMVWIFGGGFITGSNTLDVYDGKVMSNLGQVIIVSLNYRLGIFGFMPPIEGTDSVGNVGLLDQRLGLRWVYENANQLGGDREKITIFGESAGSVSVGLQFLARDMNIPQVDRQASPDQEQPDLAPTTRYFNRVIMQSASPLCTWASVQLGEALKRLERLSKATNCLVGGSIDYNSPRKSSQSFQRVLSCLRRADSNNLVNAQWVIDFQTFMFPWVPTVGGAMLPISPKQMYTEFFKTVKANASPGLDLMTGWNTNEGSWPSIYLMKGFNIRNNSAISETEFNENLKYTAIPMSPSAMKLTKHEYVDWQHAKQESGYGLQTGQINSKSTTLRDALNNMVGDFHIVCPNIEFSQIVNTGPAANVYNYVLDYRISNIGWPEWAGVMHGYEIELAFGLPLGAREGKIYANEDRRYAAFLMRYWTNFAHTGNPNTESVDMKKRRIAWSNFTDGSQYLAYELPYWRKATPVDGAHITFQTYHFNETHSRLLFKNLPHPNAKNCNYWKFIVPFINSATMDVDQSMVDWKEDMRRWREAMRAFDGRNVLYREGHMNDL